MQFNYRTKQYLIEVGATLIDSKYKIFDINFSLMKAFVNKQDTYKKRNGKLCHVEHHFGRWIPFKKEDVGYGQKNYKGYKSTLYGLEEVKGQRTEKYLKKESKERIIAEYMCNKFA
jgi:hypothetical protein